MEYEVTAQDLQIISENVVNRVMETIDFENDYIKANRRGRREADKDVNGDGFKPLGKIHKSKKEYSRNGKNKFNAKTFTE